MIVKKGWYVKSFQLGLLQLVCVISNISQQADFSLHTMKNKLHFLLCLFTASKPKPKAGLFCCFLTKGFWNSNNPKMYHLSFLAPACRGDQVIVIYWYLLLIP